MYMYNIHTEDGGSWTKFKCYIKLLWNWHFTAGVLNTRTFFSSIFPGYKNRNVIEVMCVLSCVQQKYLIKITSLKKSFMCIASVNFSCYIQNLLCRQKISLPYVHMYMHMYIYSVCVHMYVYIYKSKCLFL